MSRIANQPLTKPNVPHRFADLGQVIVAIVLLIVPAFLYASQRAQLRNANQQIGELESRLLRLRDDRELLLVEISTELDPRRLNDKAHALAGLQEPTADQITYLPRTGSGTPIRVLLAAATGGPDGHP